MIAEIICVGTELLMGQIVNTNAQFMAEKLAPLGVDLYRQQVVGDNLKLFYYRGLKEWDYEKGYLMDTCLTAQDRFKAYLDYFRIMY